MVNKDEYYGSPKFLDYLITKKYRLRLYRIPIYWKILKTVQFPNAAP